MGLFDKKFCDICGDKVNLLTQKKLSDRAALLRLQAKARLIHKRLEAENRSGC